MRRLRAEYAVVLFVLFLAGCMVGPNYHRPSVQIPAKWKESPTTAPAVPRDWWTVFRDPVLNDLESTALTDNQSLAEAAGRVLEANAVLRQNASYLYPTVTFDPSYTRERTLSVVAGITPTAPPYVTRNNFMLPLNLSYEVDLWGRIRRNVEAARNAYFASRNDYAFIRLGLEVEVAQTYISLRATDLQRQLLRQTVQIYTETLHLVEAQYRNGAVSELELDQAQTQLAAAQASLSGYDQTRDQYEHTLAQLTGKPAPDLSLPDRPLDLRVPDIPATLPSTLLERRPDVVEAERNLASANARIGVATANFFPALDLTGLVGLESLHASDLFAWQSRIWSFGPGVTLPVFEGGRLVATLDQAKAQYAQALAAYRQQILVAFEDAEDALSGIADLARQAVDQQRLVEAATRTLNIANLRYREGVASFLDVLTAQQALLSAQQNANEILRQRLLYNVLLIRALGGGWEGEAVRSAGW